MVDCGKKHNLKGRGRAILHCNSVQPAGKVRKALSRFCYFLFRIFILFCSLEYWYGIGWF